MKIIFRSTVMKVEQRSRAVRAIKGPNYANDKNDVVVEREDLGWFINLQGSWESLYVGHEKPDFEPGDPVTVTIAK